MDIEVIQHHRNKAQQIIVGTLHSNGVQPTESLVEEFLSFYDYNGLSATINNVSNYAKTVTNRDRERRHLQLQLVTYC